MPPREPRLQQGHMACTVCMALHPLGKGGRERQGEVRRALDEEEPRVLASPGLPWAPAHSGLALLVCELRPLFQLFLSSRDQT